MGMYRVEWDCCGSVTETDSYLPERCPICERDDLRRERDELAAEVERMRAELKGPDRHETWKDAAVSERVRRVAAEAKRDALAARLEEIEAQPPVAWIEHELQGTGLRHLHFERRPSTLRDDVVAPVWTELIARPAPAAAPEPCQHQQQDSPADPMDWPLPCDVPAGHVTIRKGVALRALVARVEVLTKMVSAAADAPGVRAKSFADCMDRTREARRKMIPCRCGPDGCPRGER